MLLAVGFLARSRRGIPTRTLGRVLALDHLSFNEPFASTGGRLAGVYPHLGAARRIIGRRGHFNRSAMQNMATGREAEGHLGAVRKVALGVRAPVIVLTLANVRFRVAAANGPKDKHQCEPPKRGTCVWPGAPHYEFIPRGNYRH